jgi:hypothetical protein
VYDKDAKVLTEAAAMLRSASRHVIVATKGDREANIMPALRLALTSIAAAEARIKGYVYPTKEA